MTFNVNLANQTITRWLPATLAMATAAIFYLEFYYQPLRVTFTRVWSGVLSVQDY